MPAKPNEKGYKNLTLRLPDDFHRQLLNQATSSGHTLNGHLVNIVRGHLMETGYYPSVIKSHSGRLFEVEVEPVKHEHGSRVFCSKFILSEFHPLYRGHGAEYIIGVDRQLLAHGEPFGVVQDVGLALLNFYNRKGLEIDQLAWKKNPTEPDSPISAWQDNWRFIGPETAKNLEVFLMELAKNHWGDGLLTVTGQGQDRLFWSRNTGMQWMEHRPTLNPRDADFERYAYESAETWLKRHAEVHSDLTDEFVEDEYNVLPRYVQHQIDQDRYENIIRRCLNQLKQNRLGL